MIWGHFSECKELQRERVQPTISRMIRKQWFFFKFTYQKFMLSYFLQKKTYLRGREREKCEGEREKGKGWTQKVFYLLGHFPNSHSGQDWVTPKPGTRKSIWVSHVHIRGPSTLAIFHCHSRCIDRELAWKWSIWDSNQHVYGTLALFNSLCCCSSPWTFQSFQREPSGHIQRMRTNQ